MGATALALSEAALAAGAVGGIVLDLNGRPLPQAMVTLAKDAGQPGPAAVTVFTDGNGKFHFPEGTARGNVTAKMLGYRALTPAAMTGADSGKPMRIIMRSESNEAGVAPASAWLAHIPNPADKSQLVMTCVGCHQLPAPEVRAYAKLIHDVPSDNAADAREKSWHAIVQYMNYISAWEFGRGGGGGPPDPERVYSGGQAGPTAALLARTLVGPLQEVEGYEYGAPLLVNARTVIREYEVPAPNAVREAVTLDDPRVLYLADVSSNRIIRVDATTGAMRDLTIPANQPVGPHTLVRGADGALWATPFFNGIVSRLDPKTEQWKTWTLKLDNGMVAGVHDLSFGSDHNLLTDRTGLVWYSEIAHNAVGWLDPKTGKAGIYHVPPVPGRVGGEQVYGLAMASDRTHIWYCQVGIGAFGSFNVQTRKFETAYQFPDRNAGPRRIAISDQDVLYLALYGSGQLAEYDTRTRKMIGIYDLPDRASAPYAVTWDPKRKVVWIPTSNANVIYRFDPRDKSFAVVPLPREGAFLRMVEVDRNTGALITAYGNIVEYVHGPRMAAVIDLGDETTGGGK
jgi:streptogramin lyase